MVNSKFLPLFFCVIFLISTSCKRQKITKTVVESADETAILVKKDTVISVAIPRTTEVPKTSKKAEKISVQVDDVDFNYLKIKSKLTYHDDNMEQSANAVFHIKKDSAIWFSVNKFVDVARGVITKDSIHFFMIDASLKRNYYDLSLDSLSRQYNFTLDFKLLQALLVGNMPIKKREIDSVSKAENNYLIQQNEASFTLDNYIDSDNHKLKKLIATPASKNGKMTIDYSNFLLINALQIPQNDFLEIIAPKNGQATKTTILLEDNKIEFTDENPGFVFKRK